MFSHVMVGVNDLEASKKFYDAVLGALGIAPGVANKLRYFYRSPAGDAMVKKMPLVIQKTMGALQAMMGPMMAKLQSAQAETLAEIKSAK